MWLHIFVIRLSKVDFCLNSVSVMVMTKWHNFLAKKIKHEQMSYVCALLIWNILKGIYPQLKYWLKSTIWTSSFFSFVGMQIFPLYENHSWICGLQESPKVAKFLRCSFMSFIKHKQNAIVKLKHQNITTKSKHPKKKLQQIKFNLKNKWKRTITKLKLI